MSQRGVGTGDVWRVSRMRQRGMGCSWDAAEMEFVDIGLEVAHKWTKAEENGKIWDSGKREHFFKLKIHLEVLCWSIWPPFPRDCLTHCLVAHSDLQERWMTWISSSAQGPLCISTWNLTTLHHKTFLFRHCYYICIFICIHILLKKLKYKNTQNKEWL